MKLKPVYKWKRYRGLTRRGMFVFHGLSFCAVMFAVWFWGRSIDETGFLLSVLGMVVTAWAFLFCALELVLFLFPGLRDPARET